MLILSLAAFVLSIAFFYSGKLGAGNTWRLHQIYSSLFCLVFSFVVAPWSIQLLALIAAVAIPICTWKQSRVPSCSKVCAMRDNCTHVSKS